MTTIAYKDGIIVTDGQMTAGNSILMLDVEKRSFYRGRIFWLAGSETDIADMMMAWPDGPLGENHNAVGFVLDEHGILHVACTGDDRCNTWRHKGFAWAYGSGAHFAIGAMDAGATADEAVAVAAGRDVATGGVIRVYDATTGDIKKPQGHE